MFRKVIKEYFEPIAWLYNRGWRPIDTAPRDGTRVFVTRFPYHGKIPIDVVWTKKNGMGKMENKRR